MNKGDFQLGRPQIAYRDTKANIEALTDLEQGMIAYTTDTDEFGTCDGATWTWGSGGSLVSGAWNNRGSFDASGGAYPSSGGSGTAGAIMSGDAWVVSVQWSQLPTMKPVAVGDVLVALVDSATNTQADWLIVRNSAYQDTTTNIEALTGVEGIWFYSTTLHQFGYYNGTEWKWGVAFDDILLPRPASPSVSTYLTAEDDFVIKGSAGVIDHDFAYIVPYPSDGPNYYGIGAGDGGYIRTTDDPLAPLKRTKWIGYVSRSIPNPSTGEVTVRFIGVSYNSGSPTAVTHSSYDWNFNTTFPLGVVTWDGTTMRIFNEPAIAGNVSSFVSQRLRNTKSFEREKSPGGSDGLVISDVATRQIAMTAGVLWRDLNNFSISAISAGTAFSTHYQRSGGGFNATSGVTQWPNDKYDDGSGTLATITTGKYACLWVYVDVADGALNVLYGRDEYDTVADAQAEQEPTTAPNNIVYHGCLLGRIIFAASASSASVVESTWKHSQTVISQNVYGQAIYGSGSDGAAVLDGTNLYPWVTLSGTIYTMTRPCFLTSLSISTGKTLKAIYPIYCTGDISGAGTIDDSGSDASGATIGAAATSGWWAAPHAAGAGIASGAGAGAGGVPTTTPNSVMVGGKGGRGAGGWLTASTHRGKGGAAFGLWYTEAFGGTKAVGKLDIALSKLVPTSTSAWSQLKPSQGGGGGGKSATGTTCNSGGGGGGGGFLFIAAKSISGTLTISSNGGAGGNAGGTGANAGGGGGGGGGVIWIICDDIGSGVTVTANGGAGGTSVGGGSTPTRAIGTVVIGSSSSLETSQAGVASSTIRVANSSGETGEQKDTLYLAAFYQNGGTLNDPSVVGWGLTWTKIASVDFNTIASPTQRLVVYYAYGTPTARGEQWGVDSGDVIATYSSAPTNANAQVMEITNITNTIVQSATNRKDSGGGSSLTATLAAVGSSNNAIIGVFATNSWATRTAGSGFVILYDSGSTARDVVIEMSYNDTTVDLSGSTGAAGVVAFEVQAVSAIEDGVDGQDGQIVYFMNKG